MAIKINGKDLAKRVINWHEVEKVMLNWTEIRPNSTPPVFNDYLCFTANQSNSTLKLTYGNSSGSSYHTMPHYFEISDNGVYWEDYNPNRLWSWVTITLNNVWDKVYIRNKSETPVSFGTLPYRYRFEMSGSIAASWDISSLLCRSGSTTIPWGYFMQLFYMCTALTSAPKLPFTALTSYCYENMFAGCTNLTTAPTLPATTVADYAYYQMFTGCTALTSAPQLPATTLWASCYFGMFSGCTNITQTPSLPATTLTPSCYREMFSYSGVTTLTELPATTMADYCYIRMFRNCWNIKLSETQTWDYQTEFRIPSAWTGDESSATSPFVNMFAGTWWTFTGTPTINTTYYTSNTIIS